MIAMSMSYEKTGRVAQKQRTRDALVAAARDMVGRGETPTVEEAAATAVVSRTTAYRYFPNQRLLLAAAHPETAADSLLPQDVPDDAAARLEAVVEAFTDLVAESEQQQRTMLRLSLEPHPDPLPLRQGRAIAWIAEALESLDSELDPDQLRALVLAIRSATGIEALVWLTDVAGLSTQQGIALMRWSAQAMLASALAGSPPPVTKLGSAATGIS
jgi:AcrR family transcriptional regulator